MVSKFPKHIFHDTLTSKIECRHLQLDFSLYKKKILISYTLWFSFFFTSIHSSLFIIMKSYESISLQTTYNNNNKWHKTSVFRISYNNYIYFIFALKFKEKFLNKSNKFDFTWGAACTVYRQTVISIEFTAADV